MPINLELRRTKNMKSASTNPQEHLLLNMLIGLNNILGDIRGKPSDWSEKRDQAQKKNSVIFN